MEQALTIYKASAGSGKTFALTVRYITGLLEPHAEREFEKTLAVTFTNKATAEMKSRILETLYGLKAGLEDSRPYLDAIMEQCGKRGKACSEQQIRQQAGKALTAILHDYSHFRVETIDSFFQGILRNMARELGLAANLQVELSHDEVINAAVDSLIETMDTRPEVSEWVLDYVREQLDNGDKWDIIGPLKAFADNIFKEEYQRKSEEELKKISDSEAIKDFKGKMHAIRARAERDVREAVDEVTGQIEGSVLTFDRIFQGKSLSKYLAGAREMKSDKPSATTEAQIRGDKPFPLAAYRDDPASVTAATALQSSLGKMKDLYEDRRREYLSATLALHHLNQLRLLEDIDRRIREIEGDAGRFMLSSTPALLAKMIKGSDAPFIFEKTGTFINNVMIDEFQDTSRMQWENFKTLLFEKLASGGKGLLVGDIKQSIYRWRGGDWKILYGIEGERSFRHFRIHSEPLSVNYRSHQVIVDFNRRFFPPAARLLDDIKPDAPIKLSHIYEDVGQEARKADGKGYVRVRLNKGQEDESLLRDMEEQIRRLQTEGLDLSEIAILVRKNDMAQRLIEYFSLHAPDIRLVSDEAFLLEASVSVQMIVAALRLLIDRHHTDGISEKYLMLHYLHDVLGQTDTTIQDVAMQDAGQVLPEEFTAHKEELLRLPLYLLAERLWRIFSLDRIQGEDVYVFTFLDELLNHLQGAIAPDIQTFLTAWDEKLHRKAVSGSAAAGLRILTIHKSKGLEFHTVLLPFCDWKTESDRQGDILWCETDEAPFGELGALPISIHSKDVRTSVFSPDYEEEHLERRVDALNTLYVAFTRARCNLYIWGKTKPCDKFTGKDKSTGSVTTAAELIYRSLRDDDNDKDEEYFTYEVGSPLTSRSLHQEGERNAAARAVPGNTANRLHIGHREANAVDVKAMTGSPSLFFLQSNQARDYLQAIAESHATEDSGPGTSPSEGRPRHASQREVGRRMHEVLSRAGDAGKLDEAIAWAREEGVIGEEEEWNDIVAHVREGLEDPLVASWFKPGNMTYNECSIASMDEETGLPCVLRPDRVVMEAGTITVVDYKFGHPSRHHHEQVKAYTDLMRRLYPGRDVKGYLWYIMEKNVVQVHSS